MFGKTTLFSGFLSIILLAVFYTRLFQDSWIIFFIFGSSFLVFPSFLLSFLLLLYYFLKVGPFTAMMTKDRGMVQQSQSTSAVQPIPGETLLVQDKGSIVDQTKVKSRFWFLSVIIWPVVLLTIAPFAAYAFRMIWYFYNGVDEGVLLLLLPYVIVAGIIAVVISGTLVYFWVRALRKYKAVNQPPTN